MGIQNYFLKYVKATYITRRRCEMRKTIENLKNNIYTYNNYSCKNILYHMSEEDANDASTHYSVKIDENVEKIMNFMNPYHFPKSRKAAMNWTCGTSNKKEDQDGDHERGTISNGFDENVSNDFQENRTDTYEEERNRRKNDNVYILKYRMNHIVGKRGKREQYRYTYLKSPFKYKYALRHYVFEKYKYHFYFYNITHFNIHIIFNIILSSMTSQTSVKCNIHWFYPGKYLLESEFLRKCFHTLIEKGYNDQEENCALNFHVHNNIEEAHNFVEKEDGMLPCNKFDINLDLTKYNIQNLLPIFFQNKLFSQNYKNIFLLEEKCFKQIKRKIRKKNLHWFLNKNSCV
ncbi:hypothetical protein, conserved [Plasmodium gonderi]|uniref:Uncharacterized protein n=1 Tax=Plasmodium gonderi TaxID=77519 RepID=A0A1Y1JJ00_PLAGO|nr:hypothetical protein, conserved [Plasmodium gonderi]GAW81345.1 hypothetical protein, conserved [Plasmodium gonderi]